MCRSIKIGSLLVLAHLAAIGGCSNNEPLEQQSEQSFPLPLNGSVTVENRDGAVRVSGWNESRVRIATLRRAYTTPRLQQIHVVAQPESNALVVRTDIPPAKGFFADRSGTVEYMIDVPATSHLILRLTNGEISLQGLRGGTAQVELANGRLTVLNCFATVEARAVNALMECFFDRWADLPGGIDFKLHQGRIGVRLPTEAGFSVSAVAAHGHIRNGFGLKPHDNGRGQILDGATVSRPTVSLGLHTDGGNIAIDASH